MKRNLKDLWQEALREGTKYVQAQGTLHRVKTSTNVHTPEVGVTETVTTEKHSFCCLGVLADLVGVEWVRNAGDRNLANHTIKGGSETQIIHPGGAVGKLFDTNLQETVRIISTLAHCNDKGMSFTDIADIIGVLVPVTDEGSDYAPNEY